MKAWAIVESDNSILPSTISMTERNTLLSWLHNYDRYSSLADIERRTTNNLRDMFIHSKSRYGARVDNVYIYLEPLR